MDNKKVFIVVTNDGREMVKLYHPSMEECKTWIENYMDMSKAWTVREEDAVSRILYDALIDARDDIERLKEQCDINACNHE